MTRGLQVEVCTRRSGCDAGLSERGCCPVSRAFSGGAMGGILRCSMAQVSDLLKKKGSRVYCVSPMVTVLEATQVMNRQRIGALVVTQCAGAGDTVVAGMFTERDVLTRVVAMQRDPATALVEEVMSTDVAYCRPEMDMDDVGAVMQQRRIRHL